MNNQQPGSSQQPNGAQSTSSFPPPPAYYRNYGSSVANPPPPPAIPRVYTAYGDQIDLEAPPIRSLAEQGIPQLYAEGGDWKVEMKKLQASVMAAFTDLVKICIEAPDSEERQTKLEDIRIIYINMNHMLNLLRPIQGLDNIAGMLEEQIENLETSSRTLSANLERGRQVIARDIERILKNNPLTPIPDIPDFSRKNRTGVQDTQPDRGFVTAHRVTDASRAFHAELTRDIMNRQQDTSENPPPATPEGNADENIAEPGDQEENVEGIVEPRDPEENPEE